jgi:hypothetical protein
MYLSRDSCVELEMTPLHEFEIRALEDEQVLSEPSRKCWIFVMMESIPHVSS